MSKRFQRLEELLSLKLKCQICDRRFKTFSEIKVDHDHVTNKARGLLCNHCNLGLGHFRDNPVALRAAASYLRPSAPTTREAPDFSTVEQHTVMTEDEISTFTGFSKGDVNKLARFKVIPLPVKAWVKRSDGTATAQRIWERDAIVRWAYDNAEEAMKYHTEFDERRRLKALEKTK